MWLALCLTLPLPALAVVVASPVAGLQPVAPVATPDADEVWITLGADAFATASRLFVAGADGLALTRIAEVEGVVLTRVPRSELPALSARIHDELRRCGGYFAHESRAEGEAALARLASPPQGSAPAALPFAIDRPNEVAALAGAIDEAQILATITTLSTSFPIAITPTRRERRPRTGSAISGPVTPPLAPRSPSSSTHTPGSRRSPPSS